MWVFSFFFKSGAYMPNSKFCYYGEFSAYVKVIVFCLCLVIGIINDSKHHDSHPIPHPCFIQSDKNLSNTFYIRHCKTCCEYHVSKHREGLGYPGICIIGRQTLIK